jgi:hypothetical protein
MASPKTTVRTYTCPEPELNADGKETGKVCGIRHKSNGCEYCPAHLKAAADAFWATMGQATPNTTPQPAAPVLAPPKPKRKRPGKRRLARPVKTTPAQEG